jgi:nucleotide-binding universal stress UspA family protein
MVPYIDVPTQLKTVLIAWDGGRPAARAVGDALPLLMMADRVEVITVTDTGRDEYSPAERITRHLARHGIKATSARYPRDSLSTANALLSYAAEANADLMVMGGYGHSRLREFVLGSTTRKILQTMTVPVLMAH